MDEYTHIIFQLLREWDMVSYEVKDKIMNESYDFYRAMEELIYSVRE